jgi:tRNA (guanine-N7-)-methyltransferase
MAKRKLSRFAEIKNFPNVFEPSIKEIAVNGYYMKSNWHSDYFKNNNPIVLELGCGKGEYTIGLSKQFPDKNFIGVDIKGARIWRGAKTAHDEKRSNVAFLRTKIDFIESFFSMGEVSEIWITFPDPQPKKSKARKRLTAPGFINRYKNILTSNGIIHLKTDNTALYEYTLESLTENSHEIIFSTNDLYSSVILPQNLEAAGITDIKTHYEAIFTAKGEKIKYIKFRI